MSDYTPSGNTYRLRTLHDVYEQLTAEQIMVCLSELAILFSSSKTFGALIDAAAGSVIGTTQSVFTTQLPEFFEWHDDGKGSVETNVSFEDGETDASFLSLQIKTNTEGEKQ